MVLKRILSYLIKKKNKSSNKNTTNNTHIPNRDLTEKSGEEKPKEKNKFITQKQEEKNKTKTQQGRNHLKMKKNHSMRMMII